MPIYEFRCNPCSFQVEQYRAKMGDYRPPLCSNCSTPMEWIISAPAMMVWDASRKFPNLRCEGDSTMSFDSRFEYESHIAEKGLAEITTAPVKTPHGAKVTKYGRSGKDGSSRRKRSATRSRRVPGSD